MKKRIEIQKEDQQNPEQQIKSLILSMYRYGIWCEKGKPKSLFGFYDCEGKTLRQKLNEIFNDILKIKDKEWDYKEILDSKIIDSTLNNERCMLIKLPEGKFITGKIEVAVKEIKDKFDSSEISSCENCNCMTHTINNKCGKCGAIK